MISPSLAVKIPPRLRPGDAVRLVAPASPFARSRLERGLRVIKSLGYEPLLCRQEFQHQGFLAGDDQSRTRRLLDAFVDDRARAIWCIRGGYGSARLLPRLDLGRLKQIPKLLIGFSDITALELNLSAPGGFVTVHGPVVTQLADLPVGHLSWLKHLLEVPEPAGKAPLGRVRTLTKGRAAGFLTGGNLAMLASLAGTPYLPSLAGAILFLEEVGEPAYRIDRMWLQLQQAGALDHVLGVVLGELINCTPAGTGRFSARGVLVERIRELGVPAIACSAFGHGKKNLALPQGVLSVLDANKKTLTLEEPAVA